MKSKIPTPLSNTLIITALLILICSCEKSTQTETVENYTLRISLNSYNFEAVGGEVDLKITSTKTITTKTEDIITSDVIEVPYTVEISESWLSFSKNESVLKASENKGGERTALLTFSIENTNSKQTLIITQKAEKVSLIRYVSANLAGNGNGESIDNAANFMDEKFWVKVNNELGTNSVEVKFEACDYSKAYISDGLILTNFGDEENKLTLSGNDDVIFNLPLGHPDKADVIRLNDCQNIHIKDFHFTGDGKTQYSLRIRGVNTKNIVVENCTWIDMSGIIYGATGAHNSASNITYKRCTFKRIGINGGSHMIYNAYNPKNIYLIDCHFEDCMGDYVRFRGGSDFCQVKNSIFIRNANYPDAVFIAIPCFNDVDPGDEKFGTNFTFVSNEFKNNASTALTKPISFNHQGYSPKEYRYLLTKAEGDLLTGGKEADKIRIIKDNFGIYIDKIRIQENRYSGNINNNITISSRAAYGAKSLGWDGTAYITDLIKPEKPPFEWEN